MKSLLYHAARGLLKYPVKREKKQNNGRGQRRRRKKQTRTNQRHKIDLFISLDQFVFEDKRLKSATIKVSLD